MSLHDWLPALEALKNELDIQILLEEWKEERSKPRGRFIHIDSDPRMTNDQSGFAGYTGIDFRR